MTRPLPWRRLLARLELGGVVQVRTTEERHAAGLLVARGLAAWDDSERRMIRILRSPPTPTEP